jgi:hypothetical protein
MLTDMAMTNATTAAKFEKRVADSAHRTSRVGRLSVFGVSHSELVVCDGFCAGAERLLFGDFRPGQSSSPCSWPPPRTAPRSAPFLTFERPQRV